MAQLFLNNARAVLAQGIDGSTTSIPIQNAVGLPSSLSSGDWFLLTLFKDSGRYGDDVEIVKVTDTDGSTLTADRGQEDTDAVPHDAGELLEARLTRDTLLALLNTANAYTDAEINGLVDGAPGALDTLNKLATSLDDDPDFATTMADALADKLDEGAYTADDVLAKLLTVDGEGSELDADTLDGKHASHFAPLLEDVITVSADTTATPFAFHVITAEVVLTLPASPAAGDWVRISNRSGTKTGTVARNGNNIMGLDEDMALDVEDAGFTLTYADSTQGWVIS